MNTYSISQVKTYQQCPYKWFLSRLYEPMETRDAMTIGSVAHACIEHLYAYHPKERDFRIMEAKLNSIWSEYSQYSERNWETIHNKAFDYCMAHWHEYGHDPEIIATSIEQSYFCNYDHYISVIAKPDMIVEWHYEPWLYSIKTGKPNRENIMLDDPQELFYASVLRANRISVVGCIYELIFENGQISREEIEFSTHEIAMMTMDIDDCIYCMEQERRDLNYTNCKRTRGWHCGMCDYRMICRAERLGMDRNKVIRDNFKERNERN